MKLFLILFLLLCSFPIVVFGNCDEDMKETTAEFGKKYTETVSHRNDFNMVTWTYDDAHTLVTFSWADGSADCQKSSESIPPPEGSYYNEPDGFRSILWGSKLNSLGAVKFIAKKDDGVSYYEKNRDVLSIGSAKLKRIMYGFWKGKLCSVFIDLKGSHNWEIVRGTLLKRFGGDILLSDKNYIWRGPKTRIIASYDKYSSEGEVIMVSTVIQLEMSESLENEIKDSSGPGF